MIINKRRIGNLIYNKRIISRAVLNKKVVIDNGGIYLSLEKLAVDLTFNNNFENTNMVYTNTNFDVK